MSGQDLRIGPLVVRGPEEGLDREFDHAEHKADGQCPRRTRGIHARPEESQQEHSRDRRSEVALHALQILIETTSAI